MNAELMEQASKLANRKYATAITTDQDQEDGMIYFAYHPELPGCAAQGNTKDEAISSLDDARYDYILSLLIDHLPVPDPKAMATNSTSTTSQATTVISIKVNVPGNMNITVPESIMLLPVNC